MDYQKSYQILYGAHQTTRESFEKLNQAFESLLKTNQELTEACKAFQKIIQANQESFETLHRAFESVKKTNQELFNFIEAKTEFSPEFPINLN